MVYYEFDCRKNASAPMCVGTHIICKFISARGEGGIDGDLVSMSPLYDVWCH